MYQYQSEQFQGPLDLLLQLIENQKLDISEVSLSKVTDQYLAYLDQAREAIGANELADFLVVATKLLIIKSKTLLPQLADEEEDSAEQLEAQLKLYKDYQEAAKLIEVILAKKQFCFSREKIALQLKSTFSPPPEMKVDDLKSVFDEILKRIDYVVNLPQRVLEKVVTLTEMVASIKDTLQKMKKINFQQLLTGAKSKSDIVVSFMALLELIKAGEVAVNQKGIFDDIMVEKAI